MPETNVAGVPGELPAVAVSGRELVMLDVSEITPDDGNPRMHSAEQIDTLRKSLREFGFVRPLLIRRDGGLVCGHAVLEAARAEGMERVPCVYADGLTQAQLRAYLIADNRLAEMSHFSRALLSERLAELKAADIDLSAMGFDFAKLAELGLAENPPVSEDDFELTLPEEPRARLGDVYALGRHWLMCGDSTNEAHVAALMGGAAADMLLTDPPYNVDYEGSAGKIKNDSLPGDEFRAMLVAAFGNARRVMRPGAAFYIWHPDGAAGLHFRSACAESGMPVRQCLVWVKNSFTLGRQDYQWQHEPCLCGELPEDAPESCLYGWAPGGAHVWYGGRRQSTLLYFDRPQRSEQHPTMKPVLLFDRLITNSSLPGERVLDLFGGSGTTLIAAEQDGRTAYVMELDPRHVDAVISRWEALTGLKAVRVTRSGC